MMQVKQIKFKDIKEIWTTRLWANRQTPIKEMSSMQYLGGFDMDIYHKYTPTFFGVFDGQELIGVNSGHRTKDILYRSRGIWVDPNARGRGISKLLFGAVEDVAKKEKCSAIWSLPRKAALPAYEKFGYVKQGDFFDEGVEFGPNCYVLKTL